MDRCLKKEQRVYRESELSRLFRSGKRITVFPVGGVLYLRNDGAGPRLAVSVAKKRFRHAVDRVRIKRMLREAFRLRKPDLDADIALVFLDTVLPDYVTVEHSVEEILQQMLHKYGSTCPQPRT